MAKSKVEFAVKTSLLFSNQYKGNPKRINNQQS